MERDWAVIVERQRAASTRNYGSKINRTKRNQVALSVISSGNVGKRMLRVASLQANINHYIFFFCSFLLLLLHRNTLTYLQMAHEINSVQAKYFQWFLMVWDEQEKRNMKYVFSIINKLVAVYNKKKNRKETRTQHFRLCRWWSTKKNRRLHSSAHRKHRQSLASIMYTNNMQMNSWALTGEQLVSLTDDTNAKNGQI